MLRVLEYRRRWLRSHQSHLLSRGRIHSRKERCHYVGELVTVRNSLGNKSLTKSNHGGVDVDGLKTSTDQLALTEQFDFSRLNVISLRPLYLNISSLQLSGVSQENIV